MPRDSLASNYHQSRPLLDALALRTAGTAARAHRASRWSRPRRTTSGSCASCSLQAPRVTLGLLGLGADGHTASLFSAADLERARGQLAIAVQRPDGMSAVSVTPELLARVAQPLFVVAGSGKRAAIQALIAEDATLIAWRAVQGCPQVELWLEPAAEGVSGSPGRRWTSAPRTADRRWRAGCLRKRPGS